MSIQVFNYESLKEQYDGDDEFVKILIRTYLEETEKHLNEVEESFLKGDFESLCRAAHSLKSSAANVGSEIVQTVAERLELTTKEAVGIDCEVLIEDLKSKNKILSKELQKYI